jgi:hypothetical protein
MITACIDAESAPTGELNALPAWLRRNREAVKAASDSSRGSDSTTGMTDKRINRHAE